MGGGLEWAAKETIRRETVRVCNNFKTWEDGDIHHFYRDLEDLFQSLCDKSSVMNREQILLADRARMSWDKLFNGQKKGDHKSF